VLGMDIGFLDLGQSPCRTLAHDGLAAAAIAVQLVRPGLVVAVVVGVELVGSVVLGFATTGGMVSGRVS
jgi:hypothetical protein